MADERGLEGRNPYDLQDAECARLDAWFGGLSDAGWAAPSGCDGWSRRDLLAHLVAVEEYFSACLDGTVADLMARYAATGATSLDEFNAAGVAAAGEATGPELLEIWRARNGENRAGFRAADGQDIDTSVGPYPGRLQAFHVAFEYAVHADDAGAPVTDAERSARQAWLADVARFALTEVKEDVRVEETGDGFVVRQGDDEAVCSLDAFVAGVSGRGEDLDHAAADLLSLGY